MIYLKRHLLLLWSAMLVGIVISTLIVLLVGALTKGTASCALPGDGPPITPSAEQLAGWPAFKEQLLKDAAQWQPEFEGSEGGAAGISEDFEERPWLDIAEPEPYVEPPVGGVAIAPEIKC